MERRRVGETGRGYGRISMILARWVKSVPFDDVIGDV
jgi:hypothetical protein